MGASPKMVAKPRFMVMLGHDSGAAKEPAVFDLRQQGLERMATASWFSEKARRVRHERECPTK